MEDTSSNISQQLQHQIPDDEPILLPPRLEDVEVKHLIALVADMIDRLIANNDQIPLNPNALTRFHSRSPPGISVSDYLARIVRYANVERSCLLITLHYIDQICTRFPKFTITSLTVHRFIIAAVTVSSKALCDVFCTNTRYAEVGGIRATELNLLEREFLSIIDWRLFCTRELLQSYYVNLIRTHSRGGFKLDTPPPAESDVELTAAEDHAVEDADEVDSTVHPTSRSVSVLNTEDGGMCSDSDCFDDDEEDAMEVVLAPTSTSPAPDLVTPRTAAKRRAGSISEVESTPEELRPKGRRRLDDGS